MKLTTLFQNCNTWVRTQLQHEVFSKLISPGSILLAIISIAIWIGSPFITWGDYAPFVSAEKRFYFITLIWLAWLLKFLILNFNEEPNLADCKDEKIRKKLFELQNRFQGAIKFLKTNTITKHGKVINLEKLPWYLLMGPAYAGKTTLLANTDIPFILKKQFLRQNLNHLNPSENCDWWVTRDLLTNVVKIRSDSHKCI
jgi:type VI secretion system protein ImpL